MNRYSNDGSVSARSPRWQRFSGLVIVVSLLVGVLAALLPGSPAQAQTAGASPALSVNDVTVTEGNGEPKAAVFSITRSGDTSRPSSVTVATAPDNAASGRDYVAQTPTQVTFLAGQTMQTLSVAIKGDTVVELDERFWVKLSAPVDAIIADDTGVGTITNDDTSLTINNASLAEGHSGTKQATFTISRKGQLTGTSSVAWATADDTAVAPVDYCVASGTVSFGPGETTKKVSTCVNGDTAVEANETFWIRLSNPGGTTIADGAGLGTIKNDDQALSVNDVSVTEGDSGTKQASFTISRSGALTGYASVTWKTENRTAIAPQDYTAVGPTPVALAPNQSSVQVHVPVHGDTLMEDNETFAVRLSTPSGATISDDEGIGTIVNDDAAFAISDTSVTEGNLGTRYLTYTITRSGDLNREASVWWRTVDAASMATGGLDYQGRAETFVAFPRNVATQTVSVPVVGDFAVELDETVSVELIWPNGASVSDGWGRGVIVNDDFPAALRSHNYPGHYVREKSTLAELTQLFTELDVREGTFKMVPGLADPRGVSFESTTAPGTFLRHWEGRMKLDSFEPEDRGHEDATFYVVAGLADPSKVSFQSKNMPNHYIRHQNFHLYLQQGSDQLFRDDSTFQVVPPPPPSPTAFVPDVFGESVANATSILKDAGFGVNSPLYEMNCDLKGVIAQDPEAGQSAPVGSKVTITVARWTSGCEF